MLFYLYSIFFFCHTSSFSPLCVFPSQGNVTFSCAEPVSVAVTFTRPESFLQLPGTTMSSSGGVSIGFQFRTWNKKGLLLSFELPQQGGVAWLYLSEARLQLQIHKSGRALLELSAGQSKANPKHLQIHRSTVKLLEPLTRMSNHYFSTLTAL